MSSDALRRRFHRHRHQQHSLFHCRHCHCCCCYCHRLSRPAPALGLAVSLQLHHPVAAAAADHQHLGTRKLAELSSRHFLFVVGVAAALVTSVGVDPEIKNLMRIFVLEKFTRIFVL